MPEHTSASGWSVIVNGQQVADASVTLSGTTATATLPQTVTLSAGDEITLQSGTGVTGVMVSGENGAMTITMDGGTLQMHATVEPADAADKSVTWAVYGVDNAPTDLAIIDVTGVLTAQKDGTVKVVATANGGSGCMEKR